MKPSTAAVFAWLTLSPLLCAAPAVMAEQEALSSQHVAGAKGRNLRDLGGYRTEDGRQVRAGLLYRSGNLGSLTQEERARIQALGIRKVCDFRSIAERTENPDPQLPGWQQIEGCQGKAATSSGAGKLLELVETQQAGEEVDWAAVMTQNYGHMAERYAPAYRAMFEGLLATDDAPAALLFHCTAGKDRTGVAAALILSALGVPEATIVEDYALSNLDPVGWKPNSGLNAYPEELATIPALATSDPAYIVAALDEIRRRYGDVEGYLHQKLGLSDAQLSLLRERYLTESP